MSYIALYRKWRPLIFEDIVEQEHVVRTLKNTVKTGRVAHAYLFCGTRGTGKTTMAKVFSRAVNCEKPNDGNPCNECSICRGILDGSNMDVIEIDAASNNSVDNMRQIIDEVLYAPSNSRYKVYIIDEVHMLSTGAFNALLKTLEEPPGHVIFLLATTESHKLPATILSRCQKFEFRRIPVDSIVARLDRIANSMNVTYEDNALRLIAKVADGALRDAISILDQCIALNPQKLCYDEVIEVVGISTTEFVLNVVNSIIKKDVVSIIKEIEALVTDGKDITQFVRELVQYLRDMLVCKITNKPEDVIDVTSYVLEELKRSCEEVSADIIVLMIKELSVLEGRLKWSNNQRILLEVTLIKICEDNFINDSMTLEDKIRGLEAKLKQVLKEGIRVEKKSSSEESTVQKKAPVKKKSEKKTKTIMTSGESYDNWGYIVDMIKQEKKMALWSYIVDSKAFILDSDTVGIVFNNSTAYEMVKKFENLSVIKGCIDKREGRDIAIKTVYKDMEVKDLSYGGNTKEDFISKAKKIADANDIEINILDE